MAVLDSEKAKKSLLKKGFIQSNTDHFRYEYFHNGLLVLHTKISHGARHDLRDHLVKAMSDQCKLKKDQFISLINCTLTKEKYKEILEKAGLFE